MPKSPTRQQSAPGTLDGQQASATMVSVIVRSFNRGYIVGEAIQSALQQTYSHFEIVVVDDGSTDDTEDVIHSLDANNIRYVRHARNLGVSAAGNTGIRSASGDTFAFLDSDDLWKPSYLERMVRFLDEHPEAGAVFCDVEIYKEGETLPSTIALMPAFQNIVRDSVQSAPGEYVVSSRQMYLCLLQEVPIKPTAMLVRRAVIDSVGTFNESWPSGEDWDLFLRIARHHAIGYVDAPLAVQRIRPDSTFLRYTEQDKVSLIQLFLREKASLRGDQHALRALTRGLSQQFSHLAWLRLHAGRKREAFTDYLQGFRETGEFRMLLRALSVWIPLRLRNELVGKLKAIRGLS